jgi:hypothetical protein
MALADVAFFKQVFRDRTGQSPSDLPPVLSR